MVISESAISVSYEKGGDDHQKREELLTDFLPQTIVSSLR